MFYAVFCISSTSSTSHLINASTQNVPRRLNAVLLHNKICQCEMKRLPDNQEKGQVSVWELPSCSGFVTDIK